MLKKTCGLCEVSKDLSDFSPDKTGKYGVRGRCKICAQDFRMGRYVCKKKLSALQVLNAASRNLNNSPSGL